MHSDGPEQVVPQFDCDVWHVNPPMPGRQYGQFDSQLASTLQDCPHCDLHVWLTGEQVEHVATLLYWHCWLVVQGYPQFGFEIHCWLTLQYWQAESHCPGVLSHGPAQGTELHATSTACNRRNVASSAGATWEMCIAKDFSRQRIGETVDQRTSQ